MTFCSIDISILVFSSVIASVTIVVSQEPNQCDGLTISCDMNLESAKDRVKDHNEYDVRLSVECCERWQWIRCVEEQIKRIGFEKCPEIGRRKNSVIANMSSECSAFESESLACDWPEWLHIVVLAIGSLLVLLLTGVSICAVRSPPKPTVVLPFDGTAQPKQAANGLIDNTTYEADLNHNKITSISGYFNFANTN